MQNRGWAHLLGSQYEQTFFYLFLFVGLTSLPSQFSPGPAVEIIKTLVIILAELPFLVKRKETWTKAALRKCRIIMYTLIGDLFLIA